MAHSVPEQAQVVLERGGGTKLLSSLRNTLEAVDRKNSRISQRCSVRSSIPWCELTPSCGKLLYSDAVTVAQHLFPAIDPLNCRLKSKNKI